MANKYMKNCSTPYVIRELQIKTIVKYHYTLIRMAKIQNADVLVRTQSNRNYHSLLVKMQNSIDTSEVSWQFLTKLNILLQYNPVIKLFGIYPEGLNFYVHTETALECFYYFYSKFSKLERNQDAL